MWEEVMREGSEKGKDKGKYVKRKEASDSVRSVRREG